MCRLRPVLLLLVLVIVASSDARSSKKLKKGLVLRQKETNAVDFIRLVVMRLVYGIATRVGMGENISEAMNGAFVPPGVDDYDDYGDALGGDDDYF